MGGGLMQLVAYGAQDIYLTGNPQITFFKVVYRRHTNFSMECIRQTINGNNDFAESGEGNVTISRNGDLVHKIYVETGAANVTNGSRIVSEAELEIGGQRIDRHFNDWHEAWNELSTPESKAIGLKSMQGCLGSTAALAPGILSSVQIPLQFWFCRNPGLALPLIALQYHEVKVKITWDGTASSTNNPGATDGTTCDVWCDYIYLDTDERRRFAQVSHEYLIEQIQRQSLNIASTTSSVNEKLNFNHPVKELIWTYPSERNVTNLQLKLNGHDRFAKQDEAYFTLRQPYDYHTAVPRQNLPTAALAGRNGSLFSLQQSESILNSVSGTAANTVGSSAINSDGTTIGLDTLFASATVGATFDVVLVQTLAGAGGTSGDSPVNDGIPGLTLTGEAAGAAGAAAGAVGNIYVGTVTVVDANSSTIVVPFTHVVDGNSSGQLTAIAAATASTSGNSPVAQTAAVFTAYVINPDARRSEARTSRMDNKIGVYSFALKPEEHQPSGTCNFSRIDNAKLEGSLNATGALALITVYAVNYNVLRIMSGMGGLAYSN